MDSDHELGGEMLLTTKTITINKPRIITTGWLAIGKTVMQVDAKFATIQSINAYTTKAEALAKAALNP
jgi:hypothetical protein